MKYKLYHGNCAEVISKENFHGVADLIVTSPPYDSLREYGGHKFSFMSVADSCFHALKEGGVLVWVVGDATIDGSETGMSFKQVLFFVDTLGMRLHDTMIYQKHLPRYIKNEPRYANAFEYMFVLSKGKPKTFNAIIDVPNKGAGKAHKRNPQVREIEGNKPERDFYGNSMITAPKSKRSNIWRYVVGGRHSAPDYKGAYEHPAVFPLKLAEDHIESWSNPGDMVLDPMMGSGTTIIAALCLNRNVIGIDINKEYVNLAKDRVKNWEGNKE